MSTQTSPEPLTNTPFAYGGRMVAALNVTDLDASIAWYREMLGFELIYRLEGWGWCELKSPVAGVSIGLGETDEVKAGGGATLSFTVLDIEEARGFLEQRGVRFDGETHEIEGRVKLATLFDPDGNPLTLAQPLGDSGASRAT